jgi:small subunit ribosomal protein S16
MKQFGRKHRPYYRICVMDIRKPRDGRVLEQLGTYDPMIPETDARAILDSERIAYWVGVGAKPSEAVHVLIKKYGANGTHVAAQQAALERLAQSRRRPEPPPVAPRAPRPPKQAEEQSAKGHRKGQARGNQSHGKPAAAAPVAPEAVAPEAAAPEAVAPESAAPEAQS